MADRVKYGSETHHAIRLQWNAVDDTYRRNMALMWTGSGRNGIDAVIAAIQGSTPATCAGCFAPKGQYHALGCDNEECGECHLQFIGCDHYPDDAP